MIVKTENGHVYDLSDAAIYRLQQAGNGRQAEDAFEGFAPHVPARDRGGVWLAVDDVKS